MKKYIIPIVIILLCVGGVSITEYTFFKSKANSEVLEKKTQYDAAIEAFNTAKEQYESAYAEVMDYKNTITAEAKKNNEEMVELSSKFNEVVAELNAASEAQRAAEEAERARYESLSDEEKAYEERVSEYNGMIDFLRKNNPDYEEVYLKVFDYIDADVSKMNTSQIRKFYDLIMEKHKFESEYRNSKTNND